MGAGDDSSVVAAENDSNNKTGGSVNGYINNKPNSHNNHNPNGGDQVYTYQPFPPKLDDTNSPQDARNTSSPSGGGGGGGSPNTLSIQHNLPIVLSICTVVIVVAGLLAVYVCRQYLCAFGRTLKKRSKEEMAKKSNASTIVSGTSSFAGTEDSRNSMVLQNWNGPTAFSNRYVPWERDNQHIQVMRESLFIVYSTTEMK